MPSLVVAVDWWALLLVAVVAITATVVIATLMSVSNYFFTTGDGTAPTMARRTLGVVFLGIMGLVVLLGLYLMIPYFH